MGKLATPVTASSGWSFEALLEPNNLNEAREKALARLILKCVERSALPGWFEGRASLIRDGALLFSDRPLSAYWLSVSKGHAWDEEKSRIRTEKAQTLQALEPAFRRGVGDLPTVRTLLPVYREWGALLLDGNIFPEIDKMASDARAMWQSI